MRLLEPINGVKVAQGNALQHLVFFLTMFTFDSSVSRNLRDDSDTTTPVVSLNSLSEEDMDDV